MRLLVFALALAFAPVVAAEGACVPATAIGCDDRNPCTLDRCEGLACTHAPLTGAACNDRDGCTQNDRCEAGGCQGVPVVCSDDGFACTDDVCVGGSCGHVPVDSRCVPGDTCAAAACAPETAGHDASGCVPGSSRRDGGECAEDGNACTADVCGGTRCSHDLVPDQATCEAVQPAFRHALALAGAARALVAAGGSRFPHALAARVESIRAGLERTARALAGSAETPLRARARLALTELRPVRLQLGAVGRALSQPAVRVEVGGAALDVRRRTRALARGTRLLRAEIRRLRRLSGAFVPQR